MIEATTCKLLRVVHEVSQEGWRLNCLYVVHVSHSMTDPRPSPSYAFDCLVSMPRTQWSEPI